MLASGEPQRSFGDWLRQRRRGLDLTRDELAGQIGCSAVTLRKLEAEERRPSKAMADRLAEVLNIPLEERPTFLRFARGDPFAAPEQAKRPAGPDARRHNLPLQLTSFIGRETEIEAVRRTLTSARLVTLTGAGGAGKTRLALQVAAALIDQFPDGVWLIELAPLADPALVPQTVAGVLGIKEQAGRPILATLADHLRGQTALLVVDNCEHLVSACAQFAAAVLAGCPNLRLLATSREGLGISGEAQVVVPALSSPDPRKLPSLGSLAHYEAVQLFVERAGAALPGFALAPGNAAAVAQVCRQLDGLPLAIELAAARVKVLQVEQIAARLGDRFRLLTGGSRAALPRHQALQALIDWSYDLLPPPEQALLRRLAVFAGSWNLAGAEAACAGDGLEAGDVLGLLTQLVNKSLVAVERQPGQEARYRLLDTIRQYALTRLAASGETDSIWRRLAEYYIELVRVHGLADRPGSVLNPYLILEPERDNLRAALTWCQSAAGAEELGLRLAAAVMDSWISHGYWQEAQAFLASALLRAPETADGRARARALYGLGTIAHFQGDKARASVHLLKSLSLSRERRDDRAAGVSLFMLGDVAIEQDDLATASARWEEAQALYQSIGDLEGIALAVGYQGDVAVAQGDGARGAALYEQSLAMFPVSKRGDYLPVWLVSLGQCSQLQGDYDLAQQRHAEALALMLQDQGPKLYLPWAIHGLGETALGLGQAAVAAQHFVEALQLFHDEGDRGAISFCLAGLAGAAALDEEPERAAWLWGAAEALRQAIGGRRSPTGHVIRERLMAAVREQLGGAAFAAAWAAGEAAPFSTAIERALSAGVA